MTWLSAVSAISSLVSAMPQDGIAAPLSDALALDASKKTAVVLGPDGPLGLGVVIGQKGEVLTIGPVAFGEDGLPRTSLRVRIGDNTTSATVSAFDPMTDLALLRAQQAPSAEFSEANRGVARVGTTILSDVHLCVLPSGPVRVQVVRRDVGGVLELSQRYIPLFEVRLERGDEVLGGAPIFAPDGSLAGILMASLASGEKAEAEIKRSPGAAGFAGSAALQGPLPAVTTFALSGTVVNRVIQGFLSGSLRHPWIGIYFASATPRGAKILRVVENSPAAAAGLRVNDVILTVNGKAIADGVALGALLFDLPIGSTADVTVKRGSLVLAVKCSVVADPRASHIGQLIRKPVVSVQRIRL